jgi:hypothetical protein
MRKPFRPVETKRLASGSVTRDWEPTPAEPPYVAPKGLTVTQAKAPKPKPVPTCSYCGTLGGNGTATVCGRPLRCPVCTAPGWADLVATYGAHSA